MIDKFCEYFEGTFENKMQAMSHPTKFAMIELIHEKLDDNKFRCIQRYYVDKQEYRRAVIEVIAQDTNILVKNYKEDGGLTYLPGCDILFESIGDEFHGKNLCKECFVTWAGNQTYLQTESILGNNYYHVIDKGYDIETDKHIWGSFNGQFQFVKSPQ
jgi:CpeT protein